MEIQLAQLGRPSRYAGSNYEPILPLGG